MSMPERVPPRIDPVEQDARSLLWGVYGDTAVYVDTFERLDDTHAIGRLTVTNKDCEGHFRRELGIRVFPAHKMIEAAAQTLGLTIGSMDKDEVGLFQSLGRASFTAPVFPGDELDIHAELTDHLLKQVMGNALLINNRGKPVAEIQKITLRFLKKKVAQKMLSKSK